MAIIITGGYGHIGSWIAAEMAQEGKKLFLVDQAAPNLDHLEPYKELITPVLANILDFPTLIDLVKNASEEIEGIIHTAAILDRSEVAARPHYSASINIGGTLNCLELARLFHLGRVVYTSTAGVYGRATGILNEEKNRERPNDFYGATKLAGEYLGLQYLNEFGVDFVCLRLYFAYGPGRLPSQRYPLYRALFGPLEGIGEIRLEKGADQRLDWTYVRDIAQAARLAFHASQLKERVFNISCGIAYTVSEVLEVVCRYSPIKPKIDIGPGMAFERGAPLDITRARSELGFEPRYFIEEGVKEYARWLSNRTGARSG